VVLGLLTAAVTLLDSGGFDDGGSVNLLTVGGGFPYWRRWLSLLAAVAFMTGGGGFPDWRQRLS
jgi:hypothetical protein